MFLSYNSKYGVPTRRAEKKEEKHLKYGAAAVNDGATVRRVLY